MTGVASKGSDPRLVEEHLQRALQSGHVVAWVYELESGRLTWSENVLEVLGWFSTEAVEYRDRIHPDDQERHQAALEKAISGGASYDVEIRFIKPDGTIIWIQVRAELRSDPHHRGILAGTTIDITKRKQAEAEARKQRALFEATLENMDQGLIMFDATETVQVFNTRAAELLDLPIELLSQHPSFRQLLQYQLEKNDFAKSDDAFRQWVEAGGVRLYRDLYERERPDGTVLEIRTVLLPEGGAVRTYTDITARRRAEAEVRQSEKRYRALVTASSSIVWRAGPNGSIIEAHGWEAFTGQSLEQYKGSGWLQAVHVDDREPAAARWQAALALVKPLTNLEYRVHRVDDEYRWTSVQAVPVKNDDGSVREWVGTLTDIHPQKIAQTALLEANQLLTAALRAGHMMAWDWDLTTGKATRSETSLEVLGLPSGQIDDFLERIYEEDRASYHCAFEEASRGGGSYEVEYRFCKPDGQTVWMQEIGQITFAPDGKPIRARGLAVDISERLRLEAQLRQAQKVEAMGQLTGGIAHDFNNLLTVIIGNTEMLIEGITDPRLKTFASMSLEAAERSAALTQQLLAFGRRQTLKPEPLMLADVVEGMLDLLRRTLGEHIEIRTEFAQKNSAAFADRTLLETAVLNLALNARDAMPEGGVLTLSTGEGVPGSHDSTLPIGQPVACITVSDTGMGMPPEVLERVFEPFFTTKDVGRGTGLGLSMVHGFAEQSGGHVSIRSKEGEGTSVTILLRAVERKDAEPPGQDAVSLVSARGNEKVLVVEDDPQVLTFVSSQLSSLGYEVKAVSSGWDALKVLGDDDGFDLLFADVVLPRGMSGVELARRVREMGSEMKVLLTSGYPEEVFQQQGSPEVDILLLRKPYHRHDLVEAVQKALAEG